MLELKSFLTKKMHNPMRLAALLLPVVCIFLLLSQTVFD